MTVAEKVRIVPSSRGEWLKAVDALFAQVSEWSQSSGWDVLERKKETHRDLISDENSLPVVEIDAHPQDVRSGRDVKLVLDPVAYNPATGMGTVDFYVWPAMYRVRMLHTPEHRDWIIKTDSGIDWPLPWNQETFMQIARGLLNA